MNPSHRRVPHGKVVFEVGGGGIREEIAKEALRLASAKLPGPTEFISTSTPPRLGNIADAFAPESATTIGSSSSSSGSTSTSASSSSSPIAPASLLSSSARPSASAGPVQAAVNAVRAKSTFAGAQRQDPMTGEVISLPDLDVSPGLLHYKIW